MLLLPSVLWICLLAEAVPAQELDCCWKPESGVDVLFSFWKLLASKSRFYKINKCMLKFLRSEHAPKAMGSLKKAKPKQDTWERAQAEEACQFLIGWQKGCFLLHHKHTSQPVSLLQTTNTATCRPPLEKNSHNCANQNSPCLTGERCYVWLIAPFCQSSSSHASPPRRPCFISSNTPEPVTSFNINGGLGGARRRQRDRIHYTDAAATSHIPSLRW